MLDSDVIDYIFSFLQFDHAALRRCSRAHPFLARIAQHHLYVCIAIQNYPSRKHPQPSPSGILSLFTERPEIRDNVVRGLVIELVSLSADLMNDSLADISSILSIVAHLPRVWNITLRGRCPVAWRSLGQDFKKAFLKCVRSRSVTEVSIQDIVGFEISELDRCRALKRLSLQGRFRRTFQPTSSVSELELDSKRCHLDFLSLSDFRPLVDMFSWRPRRCLRVLDLHVSKNNFSPFESLIYHHSESLTCLRLNLANSCEYIPPFYHKLQSLISQPVQSNYNLDDGYQDSPFTLNRLSRELTALEHITFQAISRVKPSSRLYFSALPDIARSLQEVPSLKHITLRLHFEVEDSFMFHRTDVLCIRSMLRYPSPLHAPHIKLQISSAKLDGTKIPPSEILSVLKQDAVLMDLVNLGRVFFTVVGHFCKHLSCCSQDISTYISPRE